MDEIEIISKLTETDGQEFTIILNYFKSAKDNNEITFILNIFTSLLNDAFGDDKRSNVICQLFELLRNFVHGDIPSDMYNLICKFLETWDLCLANYSDDDNYETLVKLLKTTSELATKNMYLKDTNFNLIITLKIWQMQSFRKVIKLFPHLEFGIDYYDNGIFCTLANKKNNNQFNDLMGAILPLVTDKTIHNDLLTYIYHILDVNIAYTFQDLRILEQKKCSSLGFLKFIFKILVSLVKFYTIDEININILNGETYVIKDNNISNLPFYQKLMTVVLRATSICHTSILKAYFSTRDELRLLKTPVGEILMYLANSVNTETQLIKNLEYAEAILSDDDKSDAQMIYTNYEKICKLLRIEEVFGEFVLYVDYATILEKDTFYGDLRKEIFEFLSNIMGGITDTIVNQHIRTDATQVIIKILPIHGFAVFGDIFNNIFNFISEVDFFKWIQKYKAITYQKELLQTLLMLINENSQIKNYSREKTSSALFNIIDKGIYIIDTLYGVCNENVIGFTQIENICCDMVQIILDTLCIYKRIYDTRMVDEFYPEVDEKFLLCAEKILGSIHNNPIIRKLHNPLALQQIVKMIYCVVINNIKYKNNSVLRIKELLLVNIHFVQLEHSQITMLNEFLINTAPNEIDYPSEFLDPLTCNPILDPVKIPNVDEFFDKRSILTHIHTTPSNPYTRETLTFEILNEYNSRKSIVHETNEFKKRLESFKTSAQNK